MLAGSIPYNRGHGDDDTVECTGAAGPKASHFELVEMFSKES